MGKLGEEKKIILQQDDNIDSEPAETSQNECKRSLSLVSSQIAVLSEDETKKLGLPEMEGKEENGLTRFILYPERKHQVSYAQMHFRLAESQFLRLEDDNKNYRVNKVEYIVNPVLEKRFREAKEHLRTIRGQDYCHPVLAFHGTSEESISSIVRTGFRMPGDTGYKQANDSGWYGRGIYLSEYPSYAREYMERGGVSSKLLLCQVLVGKAFHCEERIDGEDLKEGFDSHLSPEMHQLIIFNTNHILPSYIVHFQKSDGDFRYNQMPSSL